MKTYFNCHSHTDASNLRLKDSTNKVDKLLDYALECGLSGMAITDHESLSNCIKAIKHVQQDKFKNFKLGLGNEIYLLEDEAEYYNKKTNNERITYYHFILIAKNINGWNALKELSTIAWQGSHFYRGLERVPTFMKNLEMILKKYPNSLIGSSACIGGFIPKLILNDNISQAREVIKYFDKIFEGNFYLELQPSHNEEQILVNNTLLKLSCETGVKCIVSTDAHYLNKQQQKSHSSYLKSKDGERETESFYATTYVMSYEELKEFFKQDVLDMLCENTLDMMNKIESYDPRIAQLLPPTNTPKTFPINPLLDPYLEQYPYIKNYRYSESVDDRYYLKLIADGMQRFNQELNEENLGRINLELGELWEISKVRKQSMAKYHLNVKENIDTMWEVSLVGTSRGSACCFYVNYLLGIVQVNPLDHNLPHWRYISKERPTLPDIDIDTESARRREIVELTKKKYGENRVINMATFTREGTASAILTACRGHGIDNDLASNIRGLVPREAGVDWDLHDVLYGNEEKGRKPCKEFINAISEYEGLQEEIENIYGLISARSQHASGLLILPTKYTDYVAMMKTTDGLEVTQFDAEDCEELGAVKVDKRIVA